MKAKPSKAKSAAPAKGTKTAAKKAASPKAASKPAKPVAKAAARKVEAERAGAKKPAKAAVKPPAARTLKAVPRTPAPQPQAPARGKGRPAPRPASVAARRKEVQHFRDLLLSKRKDLMRAYSIAKGDSQSALDNGTEDYVDYAVNSYAREFLLSLTELERKQLLLVEEALARIDRGEYGRCQQCGEEINPKRLEVQPWARHCVRCQELEEQGLLPQYPFQPSEDEETADEPEESIPLDEELEPETESEDEALDEEPLVVDGDDSEE